MFNFHANTSLAGQSTFVRDQFLFDNTTTIQSSLSDLFGGTTILQTSSTECGTKSNYEAVDGMEKMIKNDLQTKISNESQLKDQKENGKFSSFSTTSLFDASTKKLSRTFSFGSTTANTIPPSVTSVSPFTFENSQNSTFTLGNPSSLFPTKIPTSSTPTVPILFSTLNQSTTSATQKTMLNTQPFNNKLALVSRNIKPNIDRDHIASDSSAVRPKMNIFSSILTKPTVSSSSNFLSALLSSKTTSVNVSNKRKLADSFLDEDDNSSLVMDDGPSSINKLSKINIKRPRMLDMNKIRSIVLGNNEPLIMQSSTSENLSGWKKFDTYDEYISTKVTEQPFRLPILTHKDYYTKPRIDELRSSFNEQGQCYVKQFTVGREHYGSVTFQGERMNLAGLDLNRLIEIDRRQVTVYPDESDRPAEGEELNCKAIISLLGVYPIDRSISNGGEEVTDPDRLIEMNYGKYLEEMTNKFHGQFVDYDVYTGTWTFRVEHF